MRSNSARCGVRAVFAVAAIRRAVARGAAGTEVASIAVLAVDRVALVERQHSRAGSQVFDPRVKICKRL
jgi:hypothetical protein